MGIVEFFLLCVVVVLCAAGAIWVIGFFAPGHPPLIDKWIWGVACLVILVALVQATGLLKHDIRIPSL